MHPLTPLTLDAPGVRLEPLALAHAEALWGVARDADLWRWSLWNVQSRADLDRYVETALGAQAAGMALPFVVVANGEVAGSTRFANAALEHGRLEIRSTWVGTRWQRTAVNTTAKLLLLRHAFETLGARRVELKTDARNAASRAAIARLGAVEEGTLRQHTVRQHGDVRDTVYFSILADEWPAVEVRLLERLARSASAPESGTPA